MVEKRIDNMKNKLILMMACCLLLSGCNMAEKKKTIIIYSNQWYSHVKGENINDVDTDAKFEAVNQILKDDGKNYQIEVRYLPNIMEQSDRHITSREVQFTIEQMQLIQSNGADIVYFDSEYPIYKEFMPLDEFMKSENGKRIEKEIPEKIIQANKINGSLYHIPFLTGGGDYKQAFACIRKTYYDQHKIEIDKHVNSALEIFDYMVDTYELENYEDVLFVNNIPEDFALFHNYAKIKGTELYIRRKDKKVINPAENEDFIHFYMTIMQANLKGLTGIDLSEKNWGKLDENRDKFNMHSILSFMIITPPCLLKINETGSKDVMIPLGDKITSPESGFGIMKSSKNKEEAFDFLCEMYTNQDIINLLLFGEDYKKNKDGEVIIEDEWDIPLFGNKLIADTTVFEKGNKKELVFESLKDTDISVPVLLDLEPMADKIDTIHNLWIGFNGKLGGYPWQHRTKEEVLQMLEVTQKKLKEAGIDEVIDELQKQVDAYE